MATTTIAQVLDEHRASLTAADEAEIVRRMMQTDDVAELALRTCACGQRIDGFYEYVDHLRAVIARFDV